jgi:deazaflavin-dependent oxidoreductase (nitroreductase family)
MSDGKLPPWMQDHLDAYRRTGGAQGHLMDFTAGGGKPDTPNLLLTTVGRRSGQSITLPLIYGQDGPRYVVVASKGGAPAHPAWYLNLAAHRQVEVQVGDRTFPAMARTASGEERRRLWGLMADIYPPYDDYQRKTAREIPVVVLEPA